MCLMVDSIVIKEDRNEEHTNFNSLDVVIPNNNENALIDRAVLLGHKELIFLTSDFNYVKKSLDFKKDSRIKISLGILITNPNNLNKVKGFDYTFAFAERKFFECKVDFIIDAEYSDRKDSFHYKSTSLNQVHAELSKNHNHTIIFSFNNLINNPSVFGKMYQNAELCKKYSINTRVFSMSQSPDLIRSRTILDALETVLKL